MKFCHPNLRCFPFAVFFFLLIPCAYAQQTEFEGSAEERKLKIISLKNRVDSLYKAYATNQSMPGMLYAVVSSDTLLFWGSTGLQDIVSRRPVNRNTIFRIASMSKSFTAMAILQLRDRGHLKLDDPAHKYVPELTRLKYPEPDAPIITIRHLLSHMAGFPQDDPYGDRQLADTEQELSGFLADSPSFSNIPGLEYEYSNLGYAILGRIITRVSKQPYQDYITKNIFLPLGMKKTFWEYAKVAVENLAIGHRHTTNGFVIETPLHDGSWGAMGGILTCMEDMEKYLRFHLNAWPSSGKKESSVLKRSSLREMQTPQSFSGLNTGLRFYSGRVCAVSNSYGFGLRIVKDCSNKTYAGHSGGLPGYGSNWNILPEFGIGVMSFANVTYAPLGNFNLSILDTIVRLSGIQKRIIPVSAVLKKRADELARILPSWEISKQGEVFAENFFLDNPLHELKEEGRKVFSQLGDVKKIHPLKAINRLRGSFLIEGEKGIAEIFFTLSPEPSPKVQALEMKIRTH